LRIQNFCDWFGVEPPQLRRDGIAILLTMELLEWFKESGASIDWIVSGDVKPMAEAFRKEKLLQNAREELDEEAQDIDLH
jgi:hypothetical protein